MAKKEKRTISDFLDKEYRAYSLYVAQNRALPSMIDGMKTGARKIMHSAFKGSLKNGDQKKVPNLAGETLNFALYPHGEISLYGTIITMSQRHKFNLNPLYIDSQNGTLRSDAAASPRYLYVRLSEFADLWKTDSDLLEYIYDEGQYIEPKYFMPIIPVVLCQRQQGMAPGYAYNSMSYNPIDIIDLMLENLNNKKTKKEITIHPFIRGINSKLWKYDGDTNQWVNSGVAKWDEKKRTITVTDLPYDQTYDSFEKLLNKFVENGDIRDWKNMSTDTKIEYIIDCKRSKFGNSLGTSKSKTTLNRIYNKFKLVHAAPRDLLYVIDNENKVRHFNTPEELIEAFLDFRLDVYKSRKKLLLKNLNEMLVKNDELVKFITLVCSGKLKIRNRPMAELKADMDANKLNIALINTPMSKVTKEERDKIIKESENIRKQIEKITKTTEREMYVNDLKELRDRLAKEFE